MPRKMYNIDLAPHLIGPTPHKDFGSFKVCGEGQFPKTFLLGGQAAKGQKL
jgi:hypothetical protein